MREVLRERRGMGEQRHALGMKRLAQRGFAEQSIDAKFHESSLLARKFQDEAIGMMKIRFSRGMRQCPIGFTPRHFFDHRRETDPPSRIAWQAGQSAHIQY